jgi:two-component system nitrogen regulation sensor histidine kinase GlnL
MTAKSAGDDSKTAEVNAFAQVARMLGHEVKNPLAGIVGAAQLLARQARDDQQALLTLIREEGARIERIVDRFSAFETFFSPRARITNVHIVLDSVVDLAKASFGSNTRFDLQYDPSLPEIEVDPDHLHEAALNLVKNGIEAAVGRQARIAIATRFRAGFRFAGRDGPRARGALEISFTDNGPGVPEATVARVFEPFFTTKAGGAGIGLAVVVEIMQAHGGFVVLDNSASGASLRLLFPIARQKGATK